MSTFLVHTSSVYVSKDLDYCMNVPLDHQIVCSKVLELRPKKLLIHRPLGYT